MPRFLAAALAVGLSAAVTSCSGGHTASVQASCADFAAHPALAVTKLGGAAAPGVRAAARAYAAALAAQTLAAKLAQGDTSGYAMRHAQSLVALNRRVAAAAVSVRAACAGLGG